MRRILLSLLSALFLTGSIQAQVVEFSTAGFYKIDDSPRKVENMNPAWRFFKGAANGAEATNYDDSSWSCVSLPHGLDMLPIEGSGGKNYRGEAWYRKRLSVDAPTYKDKEVVVYFEAIMGKSKVWLNGELVAEHFGGYTPIHINITDRLDLDGENILTVWCDNSDDPLFPPGKPQNVLDFCYFGGIYRDCFLISTEKVFVTDANASGKVAGGGLLVHYDNVSRERATVALELEIANRSGYNSHGSVDFVFDGGESKAVKYSVKNGKETSLKCTIDIENPNLWSPESPYLYNLQVFVKNSKGEVVDSFRKKLGIRTFEFTGQDGLILNGEVYPRKLIGANRHQDFAIIGNALSNSLHWRDAEKLKGAGMEIIRNAHYPQDPSFMDACDALGLFIIENTPGWQFWSDEPIFEQRVYEDIRQIVRRDRNYACVIMWEPILNETWYPDTFAQNVHNIVKSEFPYKPNYTSSDSHARGSDHLDLKFAHPNTTDGFDSSDKIDKNQVYFNREFGDNPDDWGAQNSPSRIAIQWGEAAQLNQAKGYASPEYQYSSINELYKADRNCVGGTLWHSFDHQRGYHPDPFYGGVMTSFRRPKYSYEMFKSQAYWAEPMVFIANEMIPFSPEDVTIYSNCDSVVLYTQYGDSIRSYKKPTRESYLDRKGLPSPIIVFEKAYNFMRDKELRNTGKGHLSYLLAEGYNDGKLVATHKVHGTGRTNRLNIVIDTMSVSPVANGGDLVVVVAQMVDGTGRVKRLSNEWVKFEVEGEATIVGDASINANPAPILWGEACVLLRTTTNPGIVKIKASLPFEGDVTPTCGEAEFYTQPSSEALNYSPQDYNPSDRSANKSSIDEKREIDRTALDKALKDVEKQQKEFGEMR